MRMDECTDWDISTRYEKKHRDVDPFQGLYTIDELSINYLFSFFIKFNFLFQPDLVCGI